MIHFHAHLFSFVLVCHNESIITHATSFSVQCIYFPKFDFNIYHMCDGLRVPTVFLAWFLGDGCQAQQRLDTDITLPTTWLSALQMAAPRAAI